MKKRISLLLAFVLVAAMLMMTVSAEATGNNIGNVKKVSDADINMSDAMNTEPAWANALKVHIGKPGGEYDEATAKTATGDVYVLWSDTAYYFFFDVTDPTIIHSDMAASQQPWVADSVEVFLDPPNDGEMCWQFRVDRDNIPSYYPKAGAWPDDMLIGVTDISGLLPVPPDYMSWVIKTDDAAGKYYVKMKISDSAVAPPKAGNLGIFFQINDEASDPNTDHRYSWPETKNGATSWDANLYDYAALVDEPAYVAPAVVEEVVPVEAAGGGEAADAEVAPAVQAAVAAAPQTGDGTMIFVLIALFGAAVTAVNFRKAKGSI